MSLSSYCAARMPCGVILQPKYPPVFGGNGPQGRFSGYNPLSLHTRSLAGYTIDMHEPSFWKRHPFSAIEFALVGLSQERSSSAMCDFSLHNVKSRPAKVGDKLRTVNFNTGTRGFASPDDRTTAVCVLPGTELAFAEEVQCAPAAFGFTLWRTRTVNFKTAIFRQINKDKVAAHHDALEFPDGQIVFLTSLSEGQHATVLQLPAEPKTAVESEAQRRAAYVG